MSKPRDLPDGIQRLLRRAARDPAFADALILGRDAAALPAGVELSASEAAILAAIAEAQLRAMIDALADGPLDDPPGPEPPPEGVVTLGIMPDMPEPGRIASKGHRSDIPGLIARWWRRRKKG